MASFIERAARGAVELAIAQNAENGPRLVDLAALAEREVKPPKFIIKDWLPAGEVTLFAGDGGTGKSAIALNLAVAIAMGYEFHSLQTSQRKVAYLSFEDKEETLHWRLSRICAAYGLDLTDLADVLQIYDGTTVADAWYATTSGAAGLTPAFEQMRNRLADADVVFVDGSSDVFAGNENDRAQVKAFLRGLRTLTHSDGAVVLLAHVDKNGSKTGAESLGYSGSSGWNNGVRSRWFLYPETEDGEGANAKTGNVMFEVRKSNLARAGGAMKLRYSEQDGVFVRADKTFSDVPRSKLIRDAEDEAAVLDIVRKAQEAGDPLPAAHSGQRTSHAVATAYGLPDGMQGKRGRQRFYSVLERLRVAGKVLAESRRKDNRHIAEVLVISTASATERAPAAEQIAPTVRQAAPDTEHPSARALSPHTPLCAAPSLAHGAHTEIGS